MNHNIAPLSDLHLLPEAESQLQSMADNTVLFLNDNEILSFDEMVTKAEEADIVLVSPGTVLDASFFDKCPSIKYVGLCGTSTANLDVETIKSRNITLRNVSDYGDEPTAEFIFMQVAQLLRGTGKYQWLEEPRELMGKSVGIVGLGALGKAIAHLAHDGYKMNTSYFSPHRKEDWEARGVKFQELGDLLHTNDIICISSPSNLEVLGTKEFEELRTGSILVQASLGAVLNREAFLEWIKQEENFAIFDYAAGEENYQAYSDLPRVIFPKIVAGHTYETKQRLGIKVVEYLQEYLAQ
jgi:lactate dehydrogenase-like 2-hydroxyacid dehydrogenase